MHSAIKVVGLGLSLLVIVRPLYNYNFTIIVCFIRTLHNYNNSLPFNKNSLQCIIARF